MQLEYHHKTLDLLKIDKRFSTIPNIQNKQGCEKETGLPGAILEWMRMHDIYNWNWNNKYEENDNELLEFYSNNDRFWTSKLSKDDAYFEKSIGKNIIEFGQENQGNFLLAFELNNDKPNPPVYMNDIFGKWNLFFKHFSDFIYCQIFDWQFRLDFLPDWETEIAYTAELNITSLNEKENILEGLDQSISNKFNWDGESYHLSRYYKSEKERIIINETDLDFSVEILGMGEKITKAFYEELKLK